MAEMDDDWNTITAVNNAEWCGPFWKSHGLPVEQAHGMWFTRSPTPPFYPNAVTTDPVANPSTQPRRWAIELSFAQAGRCRRLARDHEATDDAALVFLVLASATLLVGRLARGL